MDVSALRASPATVSPLWPDRALPASPPDAVLLRLRYVAQMLREARHIEEAAQFSTADRRMLAHAAREVGVGLFALIDGLEGEK